ncbi:MAG: carboxypeptidase regulatory-like domain-containing protein, partial [Chloroflexi bacterium]|nr:carboxypeptidase regulatory-like domain-containing protein [Chloroflexota bacterium]
MNILERLRQHLRRWLAVYREPKRAVTEGVWWGPEPPGNDAEAYGVAIEEAPVEEGQLYWRAVRVHHLTPEENGGKHHIFLDILDEVGTRLSAAQARVTWEGGEQVITVDKPLNEPGTNFPMWKWQVCAVEALGLPGQPLPSDRVTNLHTGHDDEAPGNTLFHHSFLVVFQRTTKGAAAQESVVQGTVRHGAGREVQLLRGEEVAASQAVAADERYRFAGLGAGTVVVAVAGSDVHSAPFVLDGHNVIIVDLTLPPPAGSVIQGMVTQGAGQVIVLTSEGMEVARQVIGPEGFYRFEELAAGAYVVTVEGTGVHSGPIAL